MAPGPKLGVLLGGLTISALTGTDLVEVLRARARQLSPEQAQLLAAMVEVGLCDPHAGLDEVARLAQAPEYAADEIWGGVGLDPQCRLPRVSLRPDPPGAAAHGLHHPGHRGDLPRQGVAVHRVDRRADPGGV